MVVFAHKATVTSSYGVRLVGQLNLSVRFDVTLLWGGEWLSRLRALSRQALG